MTIYVLRVWRVVSNEFTVSLISNQLSTLY